MTTYVKINDDMPWNNKISRVSMAAKWVYVASICFCGHNRTSGLVERASLRLIPGATPKFAKDLTDAGLWEVRPEGWFVHDFPEYNRTREQIDEITEKNRANGAKGLANRYANGLRTASEKPSESPPKKLASGLQVRSAAAAALLEPPVLLPEGKGYEAAAAANSAGEPPGDSLAKIREAWTSATGQIVTPQVADSMLGWIQKVGVDRVAEAIQETGNSGGRTWKYAAAILERWEREGSDLTGADQSEFDTFSLENQQVIRERLAREKTRQAIAIEGCIAAGLDPDREDLTPFMPAPESVQ